MLEEINKINLSTTQNKCLNIKDLSKFLRKNNYNDQRFKIKIYLPGHWLLPLQRHARHLLQTLFGNWFLQPNNLGSLFKYKPRTEFSGLQVTKARWFLLCISQLQHQYAAKNRSVAVGFYPSFRRKHCWFY